MENHPCTFVDCWEREDVQVAVLEALRGAHWGDQKAQDRGKTCDPFSLSDFARHWFSSCFLLGIYIPPGWRHICLPSPIDEKWTKKQTVIHLLSVRTAFFFGARWKMHQPQTIFKSNLWCISQRLLDFKWFYGECVGDVGVRSLRPANAGINVMRLHMLWKYSIYSCPPSI